MFNPIRASIKRNNLKISCLRVKKCFVKSEKCYKNMSVLHSTTVDSYRLNKNVLKFLDITE